jgi:hypothetical protein
MTKKNRIAEYELYRGNYLRPLRFKGELLGEAKETRFGWAVAIYKTTEGKLVCTYGDCSAAYFNTEEEVMRYLGYGKLAISLYNKIGFNYWKEVK